MLGSKNCTPKSLLSVAPKTGPCSVLPSLYCFLRHKVVGPFDNMAPAAPLNAGWPQSTALHHLTGLTRLWLKPLGRGTGKLDKRRCWSGSG